MITRVQAKNFKSFKEIDVELGPMTVLVGRNASGKSNFVDVLRFVRDSLTKGIETAINDRGGFSSIVHVNRGEADDNFQIRLTVQDDTYSAEYAFGVSSPATDAYEISHESIRVVTHSPQAVAGKVAAYSIQTGMIQEVEGFEYIGGHFRKDLHFPKHRLALTLLSWLDRQLEQVEVALQDMSCYHLFPVAFRYPQLPSPLQVMDDAGNGMYTALGRLIAEPQSRRIMLNAISHIVDDVSDISVGELGNYLIAQVKHQAVDEDGKPTTPASQFTFRQESDGTLRILGILVGLYQDMTEGRVLAFEEPELAVHPGAMALLYELFDEAALTRQIIITTQSPDLIAHFGADELRVVERVGGESKIGRLERSQIEAINEELFSGGDLLRIEGLHRREMVEDMETTEESAVHA